MRKNQLITFAVVFVSVWLLFKFIGCGGCGFCFGGIKGEGPIQSETRTLEPFRKISIGLSADVQVLPGDSYKVEISAHQNLLPILTSKVEDEDLSIGFSENVRSTGDLKITVFAPSIEGVNVGGSSTVEVKTPVAGEKMKFSLSGSGKINAPHVNGGKMEISISGSGGLTLAGQIEAMEADISGSGHVEAPELLAKEAELSISGSGSINCNVSQRLEASVSGSGNVRYKGDPNVKSSISGSGSVSRL